MDQVGITQQQMQRDLQWVESGLRRCISERQERLRPGDLIRPHPSDNSKVYRWGKKRKENLFAGKWVLLFTRIKPPPGAMSWFGCSLCREIQLSLLLKQA